MRFFKEQEFVCRCCGELPPFARENMETLVHEVLDPARERLGKPIFVNSGYRCAKHNREVQGAINSQHMKGEAADIRCEDNKKLAQIIVQNGKFDQLILYPTLTSCVPSVASEQSSSASSSDATRDSSSELGSPSLLPRFVHVSWKRTGQNRQQILRKVGNGYQPVARKEVVGL